MLGHKPLIKKLISEKKKTFVSTGMTTLEELDGIIDKFIGDAVMAVFRGEYHLDRAIDAALAIRNQVNSLPKEEGKETYQPKVSIGIKSGEMISGNIGSATLKRLDYTVIGDSVNTAARLQDAAKENQIISCESCFEQVKEAFKCENLGSINMKNKVQKEEMFEKTILGCQASGGKGGVVVVVAHSAKKINY